MAVTLNDSTITKGKPHQVSSMPEIKFIPKILAISVGNIKMMEIEVICFMTPDILLLIMLAYVSIVESRM